MDTSKGDKFLERAGLIPAQAQRHVVKAKGITTAAKKPCGCKKKKLENTEEKSDTLPK